MTEALHREHNTQQKGDLAFEQDADIFDLSREEVAGLSESPGDDTVKLYIGEIARYPLLNAEQEVFLAKRIESGLFAAELLRQHTEEERPLDGYSKQELLMLSTEGQQAKDQMLCSNLRLVVSVAKRYVKVRGMGFQDLIQEGNIGLIRAVEKFDYTKGYKFSTYATWWIQQAITRAIGNQSREIRVPVNVHEQINRMVRIRRELGSVLPQEPQLEDLARAMDVSVERILELMDHDQTPVSFDLTVGEGQRTVGELMRDSTELDVADLVVLGGLREAIERILAESDLTDREIDIVRRHTGFTGTALTLIELGEEYRLSRERIRQIFNGAIKTIRGTASVSSDLRDLLDAIEA